MSRKLFIYNSVRCILYNEDYVEPAEKRDRQIYILIDVLKRVICSEQGFAASTIEVLALRVATIPPLATLTVCCSITSCRTPLSSGLILSNSSMHATPRTARTTAPASSIISPLFSFTTAAVL